jgi:hypothetical protein
MQCTQALQRVVLPWYARRATVQAEHTGRIQCLLTLIQHAASYTQMCFALLIASLKRYAFNACCATHLEHSQAQTARSTGMDSLSQQVAQQNAGVVISQPRHNVLQWNQVHT